VEDPEEANRLALLIFVGLFLAFVMSTVGA
jgi:hypothetical protein